MANREYQYLQLYSRNCKSCKHLDPTEKKGWSSCHYSKGNEECPASEIRFTITGKATKLARQVLAARDARNAEAEANILAAVSKEDSAFQERFYFTLENSLKEKAQ